MQMHALDEIIVSVMLNLPSGDKKRSGLKRWGLQDNTNELLSKISIEAAVATMWGLQDYTNIDQGCGKITPMDFHQTYRSMLWQQLNFHQTHRSMLWHVIHQRSTHLLKVSGLFEKKLRLAKNVDFSGKENLQM